MHWFTSRDGTRFLVQTPQECAQSFARAFPSASTPVSARRFMAQLAKECPPEQPARPSAKAKKRR